MGTEKKLFIPFMLFLFISSVVIAASWHEKFVSDYKDKGIDQAVKIAVVEDGKKPDQIIPAALPIIEEEEKAVLLKALFCTTAKPEDVQSAAIKNNMSEQLIWEGYTLALTECKRQMQEWYNFIPPGGSGRTYIPECLPGECPPDDCPPGECCPPDDCPPVSPHNFN